MMASVESATLVLQVDVLRLYVLKGTFAKEGNAFIGLVQTQLVIMAPIVVKTAVV
jgi:hypothetical protein